MSKKMTKKLFPVIEEENEEQLRLFGQQCRNEIALAILN